VWQRSRHHDHLTDAEKNIAPPDGSVDPHANELQHEISAQVLALCQDTHQAYLDESARFIANRYAAEMRARQDERKFCPLRLEVSRRYRLATARTPRRDFPMSQWPNPTAKAAMDILSFACTMRTIRCGRGDAWLLCRMTRRRE
jgi:hypothetical protein